MTQFYLGTWTGSGTDASPFVPVGTAGISGWSVIDLRPNSTVTTGRCFLALPDGSANPSGATVLGTNLDAALTNQQTTAINTALGSSLANGLTRRQAIQNLLLTPPAGKWNKLVDTRFPDGTFRTQIVLAGQLLLDQPVVAGGAGPFTESFTHANQVGWANIDLTWTAVLGNNAVSITSNQGTKNNSSADDMRAGNDASGNDNEVRVDAAVMANATACTISGYARYQSGANTAYEFRRAGNTTLGTYTVAIGKRVASTFTSLASATLARAATGTSEQIFGTVSGSTLTLYIDNVQQLQITDTAITTGTRGGIRVGTNTSIVVDNYKFGDLGTTAGAISLALSPATVTVTPVASAVAVGAVTAALSPATITTTPVAPARTLGAVSAALSPATITATPVAAGTTVGPVTTALTPATIAVTPVVPAVSVGAISLALSPATIAATAQALAVAPGPVSLAVSPATITVTAVAPAVAPGTTDLTLSPATITVTAQTAGMDPGAVSVDLAPATIEVTPTQLIALAGAVALELAAAEVTVEALALAVTLTGAVIFPACLTLTVTDPYDCTLSVTDPYGLAVTVADQACELTTSTPYGCALVVSEPYTVDLTIEEC